MAYIVKKIISGKTYAYEYTSIWDKENKKYRKKSKYLGKVDDVSGKILEPKKKLKKSTETKIVDFGDTYAINQINLKSKFHELLKTVFPKYYNNISALISFQILEGSAMKNVKSWIEGSYTQKLYKNPNVSSQNISKILNYLGKENIKDKFINEYSKTFLNNKTGLLIDSTSIPSSIQTDINDWGYTSNGIEKTSKCLMLVDKYSKLPMYFRCISGNIPDVSILKTSLKDIQNINLNVSEAIFDAGFYSNENIKYLIKERINFLIRVPKNRKLYKNLLTKINNIETKQNAFIYGKRVLFIKKKDITIGKTKLYGYIICDPRKRANEISKRTKFLLDDKDDSKDLEIKNAGYFVLLSTTEIKKEEVLPYYYSRQVVEQIFGYSKNNNNLLPLRVHGEKNMKGYILLSFITLISYILLREKLGGIYTVEESMLIMRSLKCKIYNNNETEMILEPNKKQKTILDKLKIMVPK